MAQTRKLHELLKDPQEPFYVDVYLTERGYSKSRSVSKNQLKHRREDFARKRGGFGRGFLSKIFYWKFVKKTTTKCEKKALKIHERISNSRFFEEESESETKKHSPVSVLEMHHYEISPSNSHDVEQKLQNFFSLIDSPKNAFSIFEELQLAYISESDQNDSKLEQNAVDYEDWDLNSDESTTDEEGSSSFSLEREEFEEEIREMVVSELVESMKNWDNFRFDMNREIGAEIEKAILEEIKEELVLDFLKSSCRNEIS